MLIVSEYQILADKNDPIISLKVPSQILRDIALRSEENGSTIEAELVIRLARSLERDLDMLIEDNEFALAAFAMIQK